ncbi:hypothetical protein OJ918_11535, partial [Streptococcus anginosus]|nr:hypothetical protein [Streptococcus anginosus]
CPAKISRIKPLAHHAQTCHLQAGQQSNVQNKPPSYGDDIAENCFVAGDSWGYIRSREQEHRLHKCAGAQRWRSKIAMISA